MIVLGFGAPLSGAPKIQASRERGIRTPPAGADWLVRAEHRNPLGRQFGGTDRLTGHG